MLDWANNGGKYGNDDDEGHHHRHHYNNHHHILRCSWQVITIKGFGANCVVLPGREFAIFSVIKCYQSH